MTAARDARRQAEPPTFAFVGFGALASTLVAGLRRAGVEQVRVYARPRADAGSAQMLRRRLRAAGTDSRASIEEAVAGSDVVIAAVPAAAAREVAEQAAPSLAPGCLYVDPAPLPPEAKEAASARMRAAGSAYVDAAVLGTVETSGFDVPIAVAGPGARALAALVVPLGMNVSVVAGPAGRASLLKLLRSVYMKGRDALVLEMLLAARRHGLERDVIDSIRGPGEQVPFHDLATRVMASLALYAERRAEELTASAEVLAKAGVEPLVTSAGAERLRLLAALDLAERLQGERPHAVEDVLALIEERGERRGREG